MRNRYLEKFDSRVRIRVSGNNVHNYLKRVLKKKINIYRVIPISRKEIDLILNYYKIVFYFFLWFWDWV